MGGFLLDGYDPQGFYCELLRSADNARLHDRLARMPIADFKRRAAGAEQALYNLGITFTVYSDSNAIDRILPFDAIPRVLSAAEWAHIERGVIQRVTALNLLLDDIYHDQKILRDRVIPADLILDNPNFRPEMRGVAVRHKAYVNICGTDIIRDRDGTFRVPGAGWIEYDPTNGVVGNRDLIRVAVVRDARHAVPLSGTWTGFPSDFLGMDVTVSVTSDGTSEEPAIPDTVDVRRTGRIS